MSASYIWDAETGEQLYVTRRQNFRKRFVEHPPGMITN